MGVKVESVQHPTLLAFELTFEDGSQRRLFCKPQPGDPEGKRFVERAVATIRNQQAADLAERSRAFV